MKPNREMAGTTHLANYGTVVSVRGSVVDIRFDERLPAIYSVLRAGMENQIVIEVLAQLDAHRAWRSNLAWRARGWQLESLSIKWLCLWRAERILCL